MGRHKTRKSSLTERVNPNPRHWPRITRAVAFIMGGLSVLSFWFRGRGRTIRWFAAGARFWSGAVYISYHHYFGGDFNAKKIWSISIVPRTGSDLFCFYFGFNGLIHLQHPSEEMVTLATQGYGGGLVGLALAWPLKTCIGVWGAVMLLVAFLFSGRDPVI